MLVRGVVIAAYFCLVLLLGFLARSRFRDGAGRYFLAGRTLGPIILIGTMAATNFSAFTVFGASGAGYRDGLSFFPIMAFGTGFMALTFWLIGSRVRKLGSERNLVTPAELVHSLYDNKWLSALFALIMVVFTVPYLALQPMAGGKVLSTLFDIPPWVGATIITVVIVLYTLRGGLKAVAWTDMFQGLIMLFLMIAALYMVAAHHGGWTEAFGKVMTHDPELMNRPGPRGTYLPAVWFSFIFLWFFCDPMFPQLFQRFLAAKSDRALARTTIVYPIICTVIFALPISLGLLGRLDFPGLAGSESDNIVTLLMTNIGGDLMGTLVLAAGLAALMSTMDSQLLTLSSIFSRDLWPLVARKQAESPLVGRFFVVVLAGLGLIVALVSDSSILDLGLTAFVGLAVLFPTVFFGLYLKNPRPAPALASLIVGEVLVIGYHLKLLPSFGFLSAVPVIVGALLAYVLVHLMTGPPGTPKLIARHAFYWAAFALIFVLSQDYWNWGSSHDLLLGWPAWAWYFVMLSLVQVIVTAIMLRREAFGPPESAIG